MQTSNTYNFCLSLNSTKFTRTFMGQYLKANNMAQIKIHNRGYYAHAKTSNASKAKYILIQSFIYANFNYCPLIWHFSSSKSLQKIESIEKMALIFLYSDYESDYETLLTKAGKTTMNVYRLKVLCTEIYKSLNSFSPVFIKDIFKPNKNNVCKHL